MIINRVFLLLIKRKNKASNYYIKERNVYLSLHKYTRKQVIKHIFKYTQKVRLTIYNKVPVKVLYSSHFFTRSNNTDKKDTLHCFSIRQTSIKNPRFRNKLPKRGYMQKIKKTDEYLLFPNKKESIFMKHQIVLIRPTSYPIRKEEFSMLLLYPLSGKYCVLLLFHRQAHLYKSLWHKYRFCSILLL